MGIAIRKTENLLREYAARNYLGAHPVPLKAVSYDVEIVSGLAIVKQKRVFKNEEKQPIEATLTFPVGYDSVVSDVRANVGGRILIGLAKAKQEARQTYEKALDDGKATILHEELMRGLHMLSAGNIAPGAEITVEATYVAPLSLVSGIGRLRIPLTVGAIYGTSPLIESDDIKADGDAIDAEVTVRGADGVKVNGVEASSSVNVKTSAVLDLVIPSPALVPVRAKMPSGSWVRVAFSAPEASVRPVEADLLLDTSGSMAERTSHSTSKWNAVVLGLKSALEKTLEPDSFNFWTFSSNCTLRGSATGPSASSHVSDIPFDSGGTELAEAVHKVSTSRSEANILLITDGRSHREINFDVVRKSGARFTVVLIGRSAFESRVAQLAALTGGQMFIVDPSDDVAGVVSAALSSMRSAATPVKPSENPEADVDRTIGGLQVSVGYSAEANEDEREVPSVAAFAANLAVSALPSEAAGKLAEEVGIVTHLTSIVMVDHDGAEVDGIPVTRKVALAASDEYSGVFLSAMGGAEPAVMSFAAASPMRAMHMVDRSSSDMAWAGGVVAMGSSGDAGVEWSDSASGGDVSVKLMARLPRAWVSKTVETTVVEFDDLASLPNVQTLTASSQLVTSLDWNAAAEVVNGTSSAALGILEKAYIDMIAANADVLALAKSLGRAAINVAIALVASKKGAGVRQADRIARKVLEGADTAKLAKALAVIT